MTEPDEQLVPVNATVAEAMRQIGILVVSRDHSVARRYAGPILRTQAPVGDVWTSWSAPFWALELYDLLYNQQLVPRVRVRRKSPAASALNLLQKRDRVQALFVRCQEDVAYRRKTFVILRCIEDVKERQAAAYEMGEALL